MFDVQVDNEAQLAGLIIGSCNTMLDRLRSRDPKAPVDESDPLRSTFLALRKAFRPQGEFGFIYQVTRGDEVLTASEANFLSLSDLRPGGTLRVSVDIDRVGFGPGGCATTLALPDDFAAQLAKSFAGLPAPQVRVENVINVADDRESSAVTFERNPDGTIESAKIVDLEDVR
jgi:hypothetical protein